MELEAPSAGSQRRVRSAAAGEHVAEVAAAVSPGDEGELRPLAEGLAGSAVAASRITAVFAGHGSSLPTGRGAVEFLAILRAQGSTPKAPTVDASMCGWRPMT